MDQLTVLLAGAVISALTEVLKKIAPNFNPLITVAALSLTSGLIYGIIVPLVPADVLEKIVFSYACAVGFYNTLKQFVPEKK